MVKNNFKIKMKDILKSSKKQNQRLNLNNLKIKQNELREMKTMCQRLKLKSLMKMNKKVKVVKTK